MAFVWKTAAEVREEADGKSARRKSRLEPNVAVQT